MFKRLAVAWSLLAIACGQAAALTDQERETRNKALIEEKFNAWASGTGSPYELLAENATWTITGQSLASRTYGSREAFMSEVIRPFNARMSLGLRPTIRSIHADGNMVVIRFDASGTARDGVPYQNSYAWFLDMQDGTVKNAWAFFDSVVFNAFWQRVSPARD